MQRTYVDVSVAPTDNGFAVRLDDQPVRTPAKALLAAPSRALADAMADEWRAQGARIEPRDMPITRLANVAIDRAPAAHAALVEEAVRYAGTDLLCHRAEHPGALVARQRALWDPLLTWADETLGVRLQTTLTLRALDQPPEAHEAVRAATGALDAWRLSAVAHAMGMTGSVVIALAIERGRLDGEGAFAAGFLDELWQIERWGEDEEARARLSRMRSELLVLDRWFAALG